MPLIIRFLTLPFPGREIEVSDEKDRVTFGRGADCDVAFPEDLTIVSRDHFALRRELGGWKFAINREKPVFMGGRPVLDDQDMPKTCEVQLGGPRGPRLALERQDAKASNIPKTTVFSEAAGAADIIHAQAKRSGRAFGLIGGVAAAAAVIAVAGWYWLTQTGEQASQAAAGATQAQATATAAQGTAQDAAQRVASLENELPNLKKTIEGAGQNQQANYAALIEERKASVFFIAVEAPGREFRGGGTASVVQLPDGTKALATNAHVAALFDEVKSDPNLAGFTVTAIQPRPPYARLTITGVRSHPGYNAWTSFADEFFQRIQQGQLREVKLVTSYDVALMFVDKPEELGPPLTIASQETLEAMGAGDPLFYVGYPLENISGFNPQKPEPTAQTGRITANTTFFLSRGEPALNQLVQHSLPTAGGSSGSPVFNAKGEVVAFHNAGNYAAFIKDGDGNDVRIGSAALVNYAQRADLMRELLDGTQDARMEVYRKQWDDALAELRKPAEEIIDGAIVGWGQQNGDPEIGKPERKVFDQSGPMDTPDEGAGKRRTRKFEVKLDPGTYLLVGASKDGRKIEIVALDAAKAAAGSSQRGNWIAGFPVDVAAAQTYEVFLIDDFEGDPATDTRAVGDAILRVYRAQKPQG